jgi:hypothetical protein
MIIVVAAACCLVPLLTVFATDSRVRAFVTSHPSAIPVFLVIDGGTVPIALERAGTVPRSVTTVAALACYGLALVSSFLTSGRSDWRGARLLVISVLLILAGTFIGWLNAFEAPSTNARLVGGYLAEVTCPLVLLGILRSGEKAKDIIRFGTIAAFLVVVGSVVYGMLHLPNAYSGDATFGLAESSQGRLTGITTHPNSLGALAALGFAGAFWLRGRAWKVSVASGCVAAVALTGMRSAILSIALCATALVWSRARSLVTRGLLILVGLGLILISPQIGNVAAQIANARAESVTSREFLWRFLLENKALYLPLGRGPLGVYEISRKFALPEAYFHAHNQLLTFLVIGGLLGFLAGVLLTLDLLVSAFRRRGSLPLVCAIVPLLAFESPLHVGATTILQPVAMLAWLSVAVAILGPGTRHAEATEDSKRLIAQRR